MLSDCAVDDAPAMLLDPARPTSLLYERADEGSLTLVGAMFTEQPQTSDDELVGVIDHLAQVVGIERDVEIDAVPVALVHVVARLHEFILVAQLQSAVGVTLQVDPGGAIVE